MTIANYQRVVDKWIQGPGVRYFNELTNMALLAEEVGELARLVARTYGEQSFKESDRVTNTQTAIADEMADIMFVVTCLANQMQIDLTSAVQANLQKKTKRDRTRHKDNEKL